MMNDSANAPALTAWEDSLACPACHGKLREDQGRVLCLACGSIFPVEDGIPVLIAERSLSGKAAAS